MSVPDTIEPEPESSLIATIRAPLLILALGIVFLIEDHLGWPVRRTWPALLIFWGVLLIAARREQAA